MTTTEQTGTRRQFWLGVGFFVVLLATVSGVATLIDRHSGASGEWVGTMEISGGSDPSRLDIKPFPPGRAAIRFNLSSTDRFMNEYGGDGALKIAAESAPRTLRIRGFRLHDDGRVNVAFLAGDFLDAHLSNCSYQSGEIILVSNDSMSVNFRAVLHRGTKSDYDRLVASLQQQGKV